MDGSDCTGCNERPTMRLREALKLYLGTRNLAPASANQISVQIDLFCRWLGRDPLLEDRLADDLTRWIRFRQKTVSPQTAKNGRRHVLAVWNHAARLGHCAPAPERVPRVLGVTSIPDAWTLDEIQALLEAAWRVPGTLPDGRPRGRYFACCLLVGWDTGLRRSDIWSVRVCDVNDAGLVLVRQRKTGQIVFSCLSRVTLDLWRELSAGLTESGRPLAWPFSDDHWADRWRRIARAAGLRPRKTFPRIRASAASYVELHHPGHAQRFLGHRTPGLAFRHYIDPRIAGSVPVRPPQLIDDLAALG